MASLTRTFDPSKFQKQITKSIKGISTGFNDPDTWISTGNYTLNKRISGHFDRGIPLGKVSVFAGESGCLPEYANVDIRKDGETQRITVGSLRELYTSNMHDTIEINTPDGYVAITAWFDKGKLPMVRIVTKNRETTCATNHLIQRSNQEWMLAGELEVGDLVLTVTGNEEVTLVEFFDDEEECFDFTVDHPKHRYWGDGFSSHNSGKSFIVSGSIVKHAQEQGIFPVLIDTENALDEAWLQAVGVDTSPDKIMRISAAMINDVASIVTSFIADYKENYLELPRAERPKILFVIDSLGMLMSENDVKQFNAGDMKGDMGIKAKQIKAFMTNVTNMLGDLNIGLVCTNHTYKSQDMFNPDDVISGGSGIIFASSIIIAMRKLKLKKDENGAKTTTVQGIRSACSVAKTRYAKPFEKIELEIPYNTGLSPYSGLFEYSQSKGLLTKSGNRWQYISKDGTEHKYYEKEYNKNINGILDLIMAEWSEEIENRDQIEEALPDHDPETGEILD